MLIDGGSAGDELPGQIVLLGDDGQHQGRLPCLIGRIDIDLACLQQYRDRLFGLLVNGQRERCAPL